MSLRTGALLIWICLCHTMAYAASDCANVRLGHQQRDAATIRRLEHAWTIAFLTGDTQFEKCLLTQDFTEIMSDGRMNHLNDELALAEKNKGKAAVNPDIPPMIVNLHGDVAVAYYKPARKKFIEGKPFALYFADYYVWEDGAWRVYFAQQTSFPTKQNTN